jgi:hypothetical protein
MQLTLWTYEGPPHVGAMRIASALTDVHYVLHAPQGDTYADLLFTMIQRSDKPPPSCSRPRRASRSSASSPRRCWSARRAPPS